MLDRPGSKAPYVLAIDIATVTGICEGRAGEVPIFYTQRFGRPGDEHEDVFEQGLTWIAERLQISNPDAVFVEAPVNPAAFMGKYDEEKGRVAMTTNPDTTIRLMCLWGIIAAGVKTKSTHLVSAGKPPILYRRVHVGTARKLFIGAGNLKGPEAKRRGFEMCKALGWSPSNRDESDAACVWNFGVAQVAPRLAPIITPMMQAKCAVMIGGVRIDDPAALFKKARA
jgi:hypothetical protein